MRSELINNVMRRQQTFIVYIVSLVGTQSIKIGYTSRSVMERFHKNLPYDYAVLKEIIFDNKRDAMRFETKLHMLCVDHRKTLPKYFVGWTEVFDIDAIPIVRKEVKTFLNTC